MLKVGDTFLDEDGDEVEVTEVVGDADYATLEELGFGSAEGHIVNVKWPALNLEGNGVAVKTEDSEVYTLYDASFDTAEEDDEE